MFNWNWEKWKWIGWASGIIMPAYLLLQRIHPFQVHVLTPHAIDHSISFQLWAFWPYQSLYLYSALLLFLLPNKDSDKRFFFLYLFTALSCFVFFFTWPTSIQRPQSDGLPLYYRWFVEVEKEGNAFPSMHVALAGIALYAAWDALKSVKLKLIFGAWMLLICYSTLVLKQHLVLDVLGGLVIALLIALIERIFFFKGELSNA
ncbi:MAG: phosphatase PAP2 family protein [Bacteroidia bacterium]|nr:phosphatase PAP2 family protein [Bacteroidia bacterium]